MAQFNESELTTIFCFVTIKLFHFSISLMALIYWSVSVQ